MAISNQRETYTPARSSTITAARQTEYVAFLHRHPFATDAYELGFTVGVREDYSFQVDHLSNVELPVQILDNDFSDPDPERYIALFRKYEPAIAILGDVHTAEEAREYVGLAQDLADEFSDVRFVIVPKCSDAFELVDDEFVLGYAMGYNDVQAADISNVSDWRGRRVHLLGASPPRQWTVIQALTQPTLTADPPADIVGLDWNGPHRMAYLGKYWSRDGWQSADHLSIRETVRTSLREIRAFWQARGVWPDSTQLERYGPAVKSPDDLVSAATGADIGSRDELEESIVVEYENGQTLAYRTQTERDYVEYHERLSDAVAESSVGI